MGYLKSELSEYSDLPIEEYLMKIVGMLEKRGITVTRGIREFGPAKNWKYMGGVLLEPHDPRFSMIIIQFEKRNREKIHNIFFAGPKLTLDKVIEKLGEYALGQRPTDKSFSYIFYLENKHPWIEAIEWNLRSKEIELVEGEDGQNKLFKVDESGEKKELSPSEIEFDNFTLHLFKERRDVPGGDEEEAPE